MKMTMVIQGQEVTDDGIESVWRLIKANPSWKRTRLSSKLCVLWDWRAANGQMKDMACRSFLLKLEQRGYIHLPPSQKSPDTSLLNRSIPYVAHQRAAITGSLDTVAPVHIEEVRLRVKDIDWEMKRPRQALCAFHFSLSVREARVRPCPKCFFRSRRCFLKRKR